MGFFKSTGNFLSSKTHEHSAQASKEANKSIAKDRSAPADMRLRAGFRGIGDKFKQNRHSREAAAHKHAAKHNY